MAKLSPVVVGILTVVLVALAFGGWLLLTSKPKPAAPEPLPPPEAAIEVPFSEEAIIGTSVQGRNITVTTFGNGETDLLFVGGIHGGYEANSIRLAEEMISEFTARPELVAENLTIHVIPNLNPDGLAKAQDTEATDAEKRFNANGVDLNRNFDCRWQPESTWRSEVVSAGSAPFSEPEAAALRDYVLAIEPDAAVFWHSRANNVYGSECNGGEPSAETLALVSTYAQAADYGEVPVFDAYAVTGAAEDWLASLGIPAVTVELETRESIEWSRNLAGTLATIEAYSDTELVR